MCDGGEGCRRFVGGDGGFPDAVSAAGVYGGVVGRGSGEREWELLQAAVSGSVVFSRGGWEGGICSAEAGENAAGAWRRGTGEGDGIADAGRGVWEPAGELSGTTIVLYADFWAAEFTNGDGERVSGWACRVAVFETSAREWVSAEVVALKKMGFWVAPYSAGNHLPWLNGGPPMLIPAG